MENFWLKLQAAVKDREMEVKDVLENYTNLEKECESAKQPISVELQVSRTVYKVGSLVPGVLRYVLNPRGYVDVENFWQKRE